MYNITSVREKHMSCECHYYAFNVIDLGSNPSNNKQTFSSETSPIALDHYYATMMS